ncbi:MAG: DinB family protein [Burkholderiales bacterium]|nr:DinB family protein [Burkholderiales bacterium]
MTKTQLIAQLAAYNRWMNDKLYATAGQLDTEVLHKKLGAFFDSIFGTLNHLAVADTLWLKRLANHPARFTGLEPVRALPMPKALDEVLHPSLEQLAPYRLMLDDLFTTLAAELQESHLDEVFEYTSTKGIQGSKNLFGVLIHIFNHQTHHRGQVTTLLSQQGLDVGATDLLLLLPDQSA